MRTIFINTIKRALRSKEVLIWMVAFPIILSSIFSLMFSGMDDFYREQEVKVCVVADEAFEDATIFREMLEQLSEGDEAILEVTTAPTLEQAEQAVMDGACVAAIQVDENERATLHVSPIPSNRSTLDISIVRTVLDRYHHTYDEIGALAVSGTLDPSTADWDAIAEAFTETEVAIEQLSVLHSPADGTVRYYYALLGMSSLINITIALMAVSSIRANISAVGMRCQVSSVTPARQVFATLAGSWVCTFACLILAFAFIRFGLGVEFGGREGLAIVALGACALMGTGLGALIGAIPRISSAGKIGLGTGIACILSLFAGLYGEPAMALSDFLTREAPALQALNPAVQAANSFFSLAYYDSLAPFAASVGALVAMAAVFFLVSCVLMRRQRYANL